MICDTHADTLFALAVAKKNNPDITYEKALKGHLALQVFALFIGPKPNNPQEAETMMLKEYDAKTLLDSMGWTQMNDFSTPIVSPSYMLSIEGAELFNEDLQLIEKWYHKGIRMCGITWNYENNLGTPAKIDQGKGLSAHGVLAVREMQRLGIAVDTSHLSEQGFYDIFLKTTIPPLASHSCCAALHPHFRNLTDEQLRLLIKNGGYIGINFYPPFLTSGRATIDTVIDHIDHICQLGGEKNVGFGSDFDGIDEYPIGLTSPEGFPSLLKRMKERGFSEKSISNISKNNFIHYFTSIQP